MKNLYLLIVTIIFSLLTNEVEAQQNEIGVGKEVGFYMTNNGIKAKIDTLSCYSSDELSIILPYLPEMEGYDFIGILVYHYDVRGWSQGFCGITYPQNAFRATFHGENGEITFFRKGQQKHSLKSGEMTRGSLKYSSTKKLENHTMKFQVYGYSITGHYNGSTTYSDRFYLYESESLPMSNREKKNATTLPFVGAVGSLDIDFSKPCE